MHRRSTINEISVTTKDDGAIVRVSRRGVPTRVYNTNQERGRQLLQAAASRSGAETTVRLKDEGSNTTCE